MKRKSITPGHGYHGLGQPGFKLRFGKSLRVRPEIKETQWIGGAQLFRHKAGAAGVGNLGHPRVCGQRIVIAAMRTHLERSLQFAFAEGSTALLAAFPIHSRCGRGLFSCHLYSYVLGHTAPIMSRIRETPGRHYARRNRSCSTWLLSPVHPEPRWARSRDRKKGRGFRG
jgi:hypothetical protein